MATNDLSHYNKRAVPAGENFTFCLVVSEWNQSITEALFDGAKTTLIEHGVAPSNIRRIDVPGSYELIYGSKKAQESAPDAVITIGSIIQGETRHFDFICSAVAQGIKDLNIQSDVPVVFCVLTDNNLQQAKERSGGKHGNKGVEAAVTALKMARLRRSTVHIG